MNGSGAAQLPPRRWHESSFFLALLIGCTLLTMLQFVGCMHEGRCIFAEDFEVFYNPARLMETGNTASPYPLAQAQQWMAANGESGSFHYSLYPPTSMLVFYPLGLFTPSVSLFLWYGVQLLALALTCRTAYVKRLAFAENTRHPALSLALLLPFLTLSLLAAQVGTLCACLFILTLAWRTDKPFLAALALALLTIKPQLALAIPVLLLLERNFKVLLLSALFTLLLIGASLLVFGLPVWADYLKLLALSPRLLAIAPPQLLNASLSPALGLRMTGVAANTCLYIQAALTLAVLVYLVRAAPHALEEDKLLLVATATFLLSPYSFHYDAVLLAFPCLMLLKRWREGKISGPQRFTLIILAFIPIVAIKLQVMHIPYGSLSILAAFLVAQTKPARTD